MKQCPGARMSNEGDVARDSLQWSMGKDASLVDKLARDFAMAVTP